MCKDGRHAKPGLFRELWESLYGYSIGYVEGEKWADTGYEGSCYKKLRLYPKGMGKALKVWKEECCDVIFILDKTFTDTIFQQ